MAEIASWQRANQKKGAPLEQAPAQHNSKVYAPVSGMTMNSKIATPTQPCGGVVGGMSMKKMPVMLADGGEVNYNPYQGDDTDPFSAARAEDGSIDKGVEVTPVAEPKVESKPIKAQSFKEAFAENRKAGNATFEYNGKKYTTELASSAKVTPARVNGKTFSEDMAERKKSLSVETASSRNENYGNEGRRQAQAPRAGGKNIIDTSNIDSKTLLPRR